MIVYPKSDGTLRYHGQDGSVTGERKKARKYASEEDAKERLEVYRKMRYIDPRLFTFARVEQY